VTDPAATLLQEPEIPGLVWGYRFDPQGHPTRITRIRDAELGEVDAGFIWLHFNLADMRARRWIDSAGAIPAAARAFLADGDQHQQLRVDGDFISGVFADILLDLEHPTERVGRMVVVLGPRFLISGRRAPLRGMETAHALVERGLQVPGPIPLLETIVANAADAMGNVATHLIDEVDAIEDRLLDERIDDERARLGPIRRTAVRLHRQLLGTLSVLHRAERDGSLGTFPADFVQTHSRLVQRIEALDHEVVIIQDRTRLLQDEIDARQAAETNRHLHTLSILSALFLPPTLLSGLFGMNVKLMPLFENDAGFWLIVGLGIVSSVATWALIRHLDRARRR
jgi:magnesium transporter/zinc transporter